MPVPRFAIVADPLSAEALTAAVLASDTGPVGGVASFVGLVRSENAGRTVEWLEYEAFEPLALNAFRRIEREIAELWPSATIGIHHRTGRLAIGEASIAIVASSAHRAEAFAASRYVIERVKQIAPIWKRERFAGGDIWIEGATADPEDEVAQAEAKRRACA